MKFINDKVMRMHKFSFFGLAGLAAYAFTLSAGAQDHQHMKTESAAAQADARPSQIRA
jgi:hypothetical protein